MVDAGSNSPPGTDQLLVRAFDGAGLTGLRHEVSACAAASGMAGESLDDFVLAINELVTNAVRHGGGTGLLRLWRAGNGLVCEVSDGGTGIATEVAQDRDRPSPRIAGGWGLWLARQLSGSMAVTTNSGGTRVRITAATGRPALDGGHGQARGGRGIDDFTPDERN